MPKVSVITTAYNAESYIQESLDSVWNQEFQDFELILVNDGSTDGTRDIMLKCLDRPNVRMLENRENEGIPTGRNRALLIAQGEYVAIHDADDVSLPQRLKQEVDLLDAKPPVAMVGGLAYKINHSGEMIGNMVYPPADTRGAFNVINKYKLNPIIDPTCMYRLSVVINHGGYTMEPDLVTVLDFELWCKILCDKYLLENIQEPLIKYRINPSGVTRTRNKEMVDATDIVWARFRRHSFKSRSIPKDRFKQDSYTEVTK